MTPSQLARDYLSPSEYDYIFPDTNSRFVYDTTLLATLSEEEAKRRKEEEEKEKAKQQLKGMGRQGGGFTSQRVNYRGRRH